MKSKYLFNVLIVVVILLLYNLFCYSFVKKTIYRGTKEQINNYFNTLCYQCEFSYELKDVFNNTDNSISVYIELESEKIEEDYYHFRFWKQGNSYVLKDANKDIPVYVRY